MKSTKKHDGHLFGKELSRPCHFLFNFATTKHESVNLIIDIGNTSAKLVAFEGDAPVEEVKTFNETLEHLPEFVRRHTFSRGIVGSVFGITAEAEHQLRRLDFPLLRMDVHTPVPIANDYRTPGALGADRLAAAVGAYTRYPGRDILIVDAGTCLTYEFVDKGGHYKGGCISPGLQMRLKSLRAFTAGLPLVDSEGTLPDVGYDTETSIRSGVVRGMKFEIEGRIRRFREKYPSLLILLTGGDVFDFDDEIKNIISMDKYIVPRGLNRILAFNNEQS